MQKIHRWSEESIKICLKDTTLNYLSINKLFEVVGSEV
jgi:hypothetical protein